MKKNPADLSEGEVRELLDRMAARDERALRDLHELFARRIYLFAVARLRDEDAAQTVMIDTLFEVWKHPYGSAANRGSPPGCSALPSTRC